MGRKKAPVASEFLMFDVLYDDGMRTSNRKVPSSDVQEWDFDASVRAVIEAQDREIAERSGRRRGEIKAITPSGGRAASAVSGNR
jgi:hypothetical protein